MLSSLITAIDQKLRTSQGIKEYTTSADCIFRMEVVFSTENVTLADGTLIHIGDRLINLHLWNEHIPKFPSSGPTLGWALRLHRGFQTSLAELDRFLTAKADLEDIVAVRGDMSFGSTERSQQLLVIAGRYGFEAVDSPRPPFFKRLHRFGENVLITLLVLLCNPAAFHPDSLFRTRTPVVLSRHALHRHFCIDDRKESKSRLSGTLGAPPNQI